MDDNTRRRRQEQASSSGANSRYVVNDPNAPRRSYGIGGSERYRHAPPSSTSSPGPRGIGAAPSYSGYYQEPVAAFSQSIPQSTIAYQPEYTHDNRQPQSYNAYNTSMLYNVQQGSAQNTVYDANQQFSSRQGAGLQMIPPDVAAPYFPSEPTNAAATAGLQPQAASSSTAAVYQQNPADQRMLQQSYSSTIAPMTALAQAGSEQIVEDDEYTAAPVQTAQMGEAYEQYQGALRDVFTNIQSGVLQTAGESLLGVTEWLLSKVVDLGLTGDEENLHDDRIRLWRDFNHAWLSLGQKQKDMTESSSPPQRGQNVLSEDDLKKMGNEIVRLCNGIERWGLVDYEYGVWEEQILDILGKCLDVYDYGRR
ncbi:hypothetical protein F4859DRAFT_21295 [Xylaria cf. heliscus]|nr:hypothetical protein F4859DRAFT_21295 [Xylaria cf. heliscus]